MRRTTFLAMAVLVLAWSTTMLRGDQALDPSTRQPAGGSGVGSDDRMSAMGRLASLSRSGQLAKAIARARALKEGVQLDVVQEDDDEGDIPNTQAETSIAVDSTGQHVVVGFNDARGFGTNPTDVSGFMYSDDGGATFTDGGDLPINTVAVTFLNGTGYPQVFGDPMVVYLGGSNFIYFSIEVRRFSDPTTGTGTAQTMCFHRSSDNGHTWTGPFEIAPATNPNGLLSGVSARDAADKEFASVDLSTGRVMMSWSNFTTTTIAPGGVEISTTYSDNVLGATPTWSTRNVVGATAADGQASQPYFAGDGSHAYVVWRRFESSFTGLGQNVGFARSIDNGVTFSPAVNVTNDFFTADSILGNDRTNTSPSIAVDTSGGPNNGTIYVVYGNNNSNDGSDIMFQRSTDQGLSFSPAVTINSRPGADRPQWFPWVTVDKTTGRVWTFYYDEGISPAGDLTEASAQYSDDAGSTWSKPMPLSDRPFHGGYGNDTGQPNLGDYNQAVAQNGELFATFAFTKPVGYNDGEPGSIAFTTPDVFFKHVSGSNVPPSVHLGSFTFDEPNNNFIDPGDLVTMHLPLTNYVTNSLNASTLSSLSGTLSSSTLGVTVTSGSQAVPSIAPGATQTISFGVQLAPTFAAGTPIEFVLNVSGSGGSINLPFTQFTGTPIPTTIFSENFDGVAPGSLPAGWSAVHGNGNNTVPWTTSNAHLGAASNMAFHINANDGLSGNNTRFERLFSPLFPVPANSEYVTFDFDVVTDTEDDSYAHGTLGDPHQFSVKTFDGLVLRITDQTSGHLLRSVQLEAVEREMTTGGVTFYPKAFVRNGSLSMSTLPAWGGDSLGLQHVRVVIPGMAGDTIQLRWEYQQDIIGTCSDVRPTHTDCGVGVDNIVVRSVVSSTVVTTTTSIASFFNPASFGSNVTIQATVNGSSPTGFVDFKEGATLLASSPVDGSGHASFTTAAFSVGHHFITATYNGDSTNAASTSGTLDELVNPASTSTAVASSLNPSHFGDSVMFTATVTGGVGPTGTVTFKDGVTTLGPGTLSGGSATFTTTALSVGGHSITATYNGDGNNGSSTSLSLSQQVNQAVTATSLGSSLNPSGVGQAVMFTATVTGGVGATGTVTFKDGAATLGTGAVNVAGVATFTTTALALGDHSISAEYGGDGNNAGSTSGAITQHVLPLTPTITLKVNGQHPTPPVVHTNGPMALTLDVGDSVDHDTLSWYWILIATTGSSSQLFYVTPTGLATTPAPLVMAPPSPVTNAALLNINLAAGTTLTNIFLLVNGSNAIVASDAIVTTRP
jgi:Big-like domain-containing protein